jgi:transcriptional regulator with XRE-family HTH domain
MTLREMSRRLGMSAGYLSKVERGLQNPSPTTLSRMAHEIGKYQGEKETAA